MQTGLKWVEFMLASAKIWNHEPCTMNFHTQQALHPMCHILSHLTIRKHISSVIRQKGESQNGCFKRQSTPNFPKNEHFLPPDTHTCAYQGVRNVRFSENLACFVFLKHPF